MSGNVRVRDHRSAGTIVVRASGPQAASAKHFTVLLYESGHRDQARDSRRFDVRGRATFKGVPNGDYDLVVDTKLDLPWGVSPVTRRIRITGRDPVEISFQFG
jgi:hypothetical protein